MKLQLDDSRRLTGKGLLWDSPGAVIDAFVEGFDKQRVVDTWQHYVRQLLDAVGWGKENTTSRIFEDGVTVALSAPFDALYAACEVNEAAWQMTVEHLTGQSGDDNALAQVIATLRQMIADEVNPQLLALIAAAKAHQVPWLTDDDEFSLGFGQSCEVWSCDNLPELDEIQWHKYRSIPVAFITGTNGKSTSVRLASAMVAQSGLRCGVTSTDFIRVGEHIIDRGDYSGPGGARMLLRHPEVEVGLLEVARGGILRRGLPIEWVDCALITNVAEDHLGQYGINTLEALTETKFVVAKGVNEQGTLVLNADDAGVVRFGALQNKRKCWFSIDADNPTLVEHLRQGGTACYVRDGMMVYHDCKGGQEVVAVKDVPMTFNGAARHNVQNALGAMGLAMALGLTVSDVAQALKAFRSDAADNPGRGNVFEVNGATVVMDFAHNEHSMAAIVATANNMPSTRKWLMLSAAGDRSDEDMRVMTAAGMRLNPDKMVAYDLPSYRRGREVGEIPRRIGEFAMACGLAGEKLLHCDGPVSGAQTILSELQPGDLALLLVLSERDEVVKLIEQAQRG